MAEETLLIRADASVAMGTGHVMRCLAVAQAWQDAGGRVAFATVEPSALMRERLLSEGIEVIPLEKQPGSADDASCVADLVKQRSGDWVVVDGYHFDGDYQRDLKAAGLQVLYVDDNAQAGHYAADLILNQNANADESLYRNRESYTRLMLGSGYVMLRREFQPWREWTREIPEFGRKILITMGGSDPDNITLRAIEALTDARLKGLEARIVIGSSNPNFEALEQMVSRAGPGLRLQQNAHDMPGLMAWADMALIAAGGTLWELLFMGCSVLSYARGPVQGRIISELGRQGMVEDLGDPQKSDPVSLAATIGELARSPERRRRMAALGREQVDGRGARRTCERLMTHDVSDLAVTLESVTLVDRQAFLKMAEKYFRELDSRFVCQEDWKRHYFDGIVGNPRLSLRWILVGGHQVGFILFGLEEHICLPRRNAVVYELYVAPEFRRHGVARACAQQAIDELQSHAPSKVQLEIVRNNHGAAALWASLGFEKVAERWVLKKART
jgi:UDP-2,4-diacetamido-2,4,6-trideoxy-beta-L-altropyranose hydrolase